MRPFCLYQRSYLSEAISLLQLECLSSRHYPHGIVIHKDLANIATGQEILVVGL